MLSSVSLGILASLIAALFFGIYPVPRRYVKFGINDYMISMTIGVMGTGFLISTVFLSSFTGALGLTLTYIEFGTSLLAGGLWSLGTLLYVYSVDCVGVGRATPVKNITAVIGVSFGLLLFQEYEGLTMLSLILLIVGTIFIVLSGKFLGFIQGREGLSRPSCPVNLVVPEFFGDDRKTTITAGWILALGAAFMYGFQSISIKFLSSSTDTVFQFLTAVGIGALLTSLIADRILTSTHNWRKEPLKEHVYAISGGILWVVAFVGLATGIKLVGLSVSWPMAMSSTVFAVLYALFFGRELDFSENKSSILKGLVLGISGIILLGLSM